MFGRKKNTAPPKKSEGGKALMAQMGFVVDIDDMVMGSPDGDDDLEAELRALQDENEREHGIKSNKQKQNEPKKIKSAAELEKMIALSMKDVPDDDDDDVEVSDTEDPDILAELNELMSDDDDSQSASNNKPQQQSSSSSSSSSLLKLLDERLNNYQDGVQASKEIGDQSKTRRLERGLKTLEDLLRSVKSGRSIDESDIPPAIVVPTKVKVNSNNDSTTARGVSEVGAGGKGGSTVIHLSSAGVPSAYSDTKPSQQQPQQQLQQHQFPQQPPSQQPPRQQPPQEQLPRTSLTPKPPPPPPTTTPTTITKPGMSTNEFLSLPDDKKLHVLMKQHEAYKSEALKMKKEGSNDKAVQFIRISKQFESVARALQEGKPVDYNGMPPFISSSSSTPSSSSAAAASGVKISSKITRDGMQGSSSSSSSPHHPPPQSSSSPHHPPPPQSSSSPHDATQAEPEIPMLTNEETKKLYKAPDVGGTLMEALMARLNKYKESEQQANTENNGSKARRMNRIVKQYEEAIKMTKSKKPYNYDELPSPPGFPPLPLNNGPQQQQQPQPPQQPQQQQPPQQPTQSSLPSSPPTKKPSPQLPPSSPTTSPTTKSKPAVVARQASTVYSRAEQQAAFLEQRQLQFKKAAMQAKTSGDMELAKKYMRMAKGFDQMIEASKSGLPVDLSQIPTPPGDNSDGDFVFVNATDVPAELTGDAKEVYKRLQDELVHQIKTSETNRDMFTKLGDISSANKFERMSEGSRKDLESLKNAFEHGDPVPRFHYEARTFSIVHCCPELGDNDLEVTVVRGLNFNSPSGYNPADLHTYVRFEFPFPETPQVGDTPVIKGTCSPEFNHVVKLEVNRKSRSFLRLLKSSKTFKLDVYYKRGFLKGDKILGSVQIKLQPLEDKCIYHDSYDLMEGRKAVGGKLEVKIRVRDPFINKQVEEMKEKWLVIDEFIRNVAPVQPPRSSPQKLPRSKPTTLQQQHHQPPQQQQQQASSSSASTNHNCISVLLYERDVLNERISKYQSRMKPAEVELLRQKSNLLSKRANDLKNQVHEGGEAVVRAYVNSLKQMSNAYIAEARSKASQQNNNDQVKVTLEKKSLVDKEIDILMKKLQGKK